MPSSIYDKDPDARLDYAWDWTAWLHAGETITASGVTVESGDVVVEGDDQTGGIVTAWVAGGTLGVISYVTCHVTTSAGREDDRTITLQIHER